MLRIYTDSSHLISRVYFLITPRLPLTKNRTYIKKERERETDREIYVIFEVLKFAIDLKKKTRIVDLIESSHRFFLLSI